MAQNKRKGRPGGKEGSDKSYPNESLSATELALKKVSKIIKTGVIHMIHNGFINLKEGLELMP